MSNTILNQPTAANLAGKTVIVTGANSGIGFETARSLAGRGARIILACRNPELGLLAAERIRQEYPGADVRFAALDLGNLSSVRAFAKKFKAEETSLDILCNNAGLMMCPYEKTADGFEMQFGTNHLGHFALTGLLLDNIRSTPGARVVTVSSSFHKSGRIDFANLNAEQSYSRDKAYQQSKLANLLFAFELQRRFHFNGIDAISVAAHPGYAATKLQRYNLLFRFTNLFFAQSAADGALPTLYAASAPDVVGGEYYGPNGPAEMKGLPARVSPSPQAQDETIARQLWKVSEELTGVAYGI